MTDPDEDDLIGILPPKDIEYFDRPEGLCQMSLGNHDTCQYSAVGGTDYCDAHVGGKFHVPVVDTFDADVAERLQSLRVAAEARRQFAVEEAVEQPVISPTSLVALLAEPDEEARYLIDDVWPAGGRVLFAAQFKAGKTTAVGNVARSLADGDLFLDNYKVQQVERVVLLDNELSTGMVRQWLREQGIQNPDRVAVMAMRGRLSGFDIRQPEVRAKWAQAIGPADVLILDCLRPLMDALGLNEHSEAGVVLTGLDEFCVEANIKQLMVVHHMGHQNERSRGDSRMQDWPDALWKLVRQDDDPASQRFFSAYGRDVDVPEVGLAYEGRRLRVVGGNRKTSAMALHTEAVLAFVAANPECSQTAVENDVQGDRTAIRACLKSLVANGQVVQEKKGQKFCHSIAPSPFDPLPERADV